jgi:hypothetical protein
MAETVLSAPPPGVLGAWDVAESDFPAAGTAAERLLFCLRYAVLAPSGHNSQPWVFCLAGDAVDLYADRGRRLPVVDPQDRELTISCGAALLQLRLAIQRFGHEPAVQTFPDPTQADLLARVRLGPRRRATGDEGRLFAAITKRRTNRQPFHERPVPLALLAVLGAAAAEEGAWLHVAAGPEERLALAGLVAEGDRLQWADPRFRDELAAWLRPNDSPYRDGIPGYGLGLGDLLSHAGPVVLRTFDLGRGLAARDRHVATGSPVLAVLGSEADSPAAWLAAGQALARVLLRARAEGVWASFLNQPVEVAGLRTRLQYLIRRPGFPQLVLRMGYGLDVRPTPRRTLAEVVVGRAAPT